MGAGPLHADCSRICETSVEDRRVECVTSGRDPDRVVLAWDSASPRSHEASRSSTKSAPSEYRIRFYNFNMGNSSNFQSVDQLQGPGGRGKFQDALGERFVDGLAPDVSFATFVETRLNFREWIEQYMAKRSSSRLDSLVAQSARREGKKSNRNLMLSLMEGIAATYNGNLKSMLAFCSKDFVEDSSGGLFGRLNEPRLGGMVPNPKKAFIGRSLVLQGEAGRGIRLSFVGTHFPISQVAAALEDPSKDPLEGAKIALAKTLRKVLKKASLRKLTDEKTIIFLQGDINSRTVLRGSEVNDALLEVLEDESLQSAMQAELELPPGRWREVVPHHSVNDLPVTYKFNAEKSCQTGNSPVRSGSNDPEHYLTIGDVMSKACGFQHGLYKRTLASLGEWLDTWGVAFKQHDFRSFRFPACADRVIYWASDELHDYLSLELPRGGYEVNHGQLGSDHRPVSLEVVMKLYSSKIRHSTHLKPARSFMGEGYLSEAEDLASEEDPDDLYEATPKTVASSPPAFGKAASLSSRRLFADGAASEDEGT
ncbi:unnamed protein product [Effrenium voratum]|nr:unnamed protein product [Effrenium voratum]